MSCYLQYSAIWGTKVAESAVPQSRDQHRSEQDIFHPTVEEVNSVVRLCHQGRHGTACVITFRALLTWRKCGWNIWQHIYPHDTPVFWQEEVSRETFHSSIQRGSALAASALTGTSCESYKVIKLQWLWAICVRLVMFPQCRLLAYWNWTSHNSVHDTSRGWVMGTCGWLAGHAPHNGN